MFLLPLPSPACTIPSLACIMPFPPLNKLPNKLAPKAPSNILKNPPFCSLVSFSIVLLNLAKIALTYTKIPLLNKIPEFSNASIIFIISFMSSCSIISLTPEP